MHLLIQFHTLLDLCRQKVGGSTVVITGKTYFWGPPTLFCFLLPISTVILSGESLFGDHPPYLLPVSTMVLTGYKIERVPPSVADNIFAVW